MKVFSFQGFGYWLYQSGLIQWEYGKHFTDLFRWHNNGTSNILWYLRNLDLRIELLTCWPVPTDQMNKWWNNHQFGLHGQNPELDIEKHLRFSSKNFCHSFKEPFKLLESCGSQRTRMIGNCTEIPITCSTCITNLIILWLLTILFHFAQTNK